MEGFGFFRELLYKNVSKSAAMLNERKHWLILRPFSIFAPDDGVFLEEVENPMNFCCIRMI